MSDHGVDEERGDMVTKMDMVAKMEVLAKEWREKMAGSVEARRARENLKLHKIKMKKLAEELSIAEASWRQRGAELKNLSCRLFFGSLIG